MNNRGLLTLLVVWLATGLLAITGFYYYSNRYAPENIRREISRTAAGTNSVNRLLDILPDLFNHHGNLLAIFVTGQDGKLLGTMYKPGRLERNDYARLVEEFRKEKNILSYNFRILKPVISPVKDVLIYPLTSRMDVLSAWRSLRENSPGWLIAAGIYLTFGLLLVALIMTGNEKKNFERYREPFSRNAKGVDEKLSEIKNPLFREDTILDLFNAIHDKYDLLKACCLIRENAEWVTAVEKRGELIIRGSAVKIPAELPDATENSWREPIFIFDREVIVPMIVRRVLAGAVYLKFSQKPDDENYLALISRSSDRITIQQTYEKAAFDNNTGFYTWAHYRFLVSERLHAHTQMRVLIFHLDGISRISPDSLHSWAGRIRGWMKIYDNQSFAGRISEDNFSLVFSSIEEKIPVVRAFNGIKNEDITLSDSQLLEKLRDLTEAELGKRINVFGGILTTSDMDSDIQAFSGKTDYILTQAQEKKHLAVYREEFVSGVL